MSRFGLRALSCSNLSLMKVSAFEECFDFAERFGFDRSPGANPTARHIIACGRRAAHAARISAQECNPMSAVVDEPGSAGTAPASRDAGSARAAGVMILAAILFFARLGGRGLWSSEFRWAEIAREMRLSGNYFWPTINGRLYYDKPLASYWLVLWAADLTGALNEAAARIPCAIAGLAAVGLLMILARRLYDQRTAALSGLVLATCMSFVFFSRTASADVETITGELAALLLFVSMRERAGQWWVVPLWLLMALTSLTKGLLGFVLPIV